MNINLTLSIIAIVLSVVSISLLSWIYFIFKNLIKIANDKEFINNTKEIKAIKSELAEFQKYSKSGLNRVGLVKYNPFNEAGGDHSFSLALLDDYKNGIIITSLHTRERTRLYIKDVVLGKVKLTLSKEEQKALQLSTK